MLKPSTIIEFLSISTLSHFEEFMLSMFQCYVLQSMKVHGLDYDFATDHNFYQYHTTLFALLNALCFEFCTGHFPSCLSLSFGSHFPHTFML